MPAAFGKYRLLRQLGEGGMGEVWLACQDRGPGAPRLTVIKRMLPHLDGHDELVGLFVNEGRIATRLDHPNLAQVLDVGRVDGRYFMSREFVPGAALRELMARDQTARALDLGAVGHLIGRVCDGLAHAHAAHDEAGHPLHLVHGDVSPDNLVVGYDGSVKLIDFGVARTRLAAADPAAAARGTYGYMAPEQARGETVDARADVFAAGVLLWELIARRRLFARPASYLTLAAVVEDAAPSLAGTRPELGAAAAADLDRLLGAALAKDPAERLASSAALGGELAALAERHQWHSGPDALEAALATLYMAERQAVNGALAASRASSLEEHLIAAPVIDDLAWLLGRW